ncbi:MAG: SDR family NAD(P)-dependent oxidoreductase [Myxococcales bacterium]|nr:SDR family NAD(P)-dependent oxidoreductase [Myxococcales bacterium]
MATAQIVVTTGANSGIGFEAALHFARSGARIVMACRSVDRGLAAQRQIQQSVAGADTIVLPLDVSEPASIADFLERFRDRVGELDVLINNAGVAVLPLARTTSGHEMHLATNYLGAFALTGRLLPYFRTGGRARIVNVGSIAHRFGRLNVDDLNWERTAYHEWKAYANSKLAILNHTFELDRRLKQTGSHVEALAAHPGIAKTSISDKSPTLRPKGTLRKWYTKRMEKVVPSAYRAVRSILLAATAEDASGGDYYGPGGIFELGGDPKPARLHPQVKDAELGRRLWEVSESMTGLDFLSERQ